MKDLIVGFLNDDLIRVRSYEEGKEDKAKIHFQLKIWQFLLIGLVTTITFKEAFIIFLMKGILYLHFLNSKEERI